MDRVIHQTECPDEAKLLAFFEKNLSYFGRRAVERHLARCGDCCDSLAFLVKSLNSGTLLDEVHSFELDDNALSAQTASILTLIENTDRSERISRAQESFSRPRKLVFGFSYRALAASAAILVVAVSSYIVLSNYFSSASQAHRMLALAMKSSRNIALQIPGMAHSEIKGTTRAVTTSSFDSIEYDRALREISPNGEIPRRESDRLEMAKILIARSGGKQDAEKALGIVDELLKEQATNGELLTLRGMALYNLGDNNGAIVAFTSALQTSPSPIAAYFNRALVEKGMGRNGDAQNDLQKYIENEKDSGWRAEAQAVLREISNN